MGIKLKLKLLLKGLFNSIIRSKTLKNKILRFFNRDYELSQRELESLFNTPILKDIKRENFIVSLTTFPKRIESLKYTLHSIFMQDVRPKKVILSLSIEEFMQDCGSMELPSYIKEFEAFGLEVLWNEENLRQYNKIIPILKKYPNDVIVSLDDDIYYPQGLLRGLYHAHLSNKNVIWTQRARIVSFTSTSIRSFFEWKLIKRNNSLWQNRASFKLFLEGVGGVLYPPNSLYKDACNKDLFMRLCPKADDIWLWAMAILNDTKIAVVEHNLMASGNAMVISPYQQSLWLDNLTSGNNKQVESMLEAYPSILEKLHVKDSRILQLGKFYPPDLGGIESVIEDITTSLRARGLQNDVLCSNSKREYKEEIVSCGAKIMRCASFGKVASTSISPQMIFKLRSVIKSYDIIHIHLPDPMANLALFLSNLKGKKIIIHWHSDIIKQKNLLKLYLPLQNWLLRRADKIIATSNKYIKESSYLYRYQDKCICIPIGFDKSVFLEESSAIKPPFKKNKKVIFSLGRFARNKGFEYLIQSAKYLSNDYLIAIGGGGNKELEKEFRALIKKENLKDKVILLGKIPRNNLASYYNSSHIVILPSIQESYGIVLIEAMSFSKPIICTRLTPSGMDFINEDSKSGIVIPPKNPKAIAEAVIKIDKDYNYFAKNAYERYLAYFTQEDMIDKIINLYSII